MQRVGLIIPSSNVVIEDTLRHHAGALAPTVAIHVARFSVTAVDLGAGSTAQFRDDPIDAAIDQLREAGVERIAFAGTAGAWLGIERERAWQRRAAGRAGVAVTSTTLLAIDALRAAGVRRPPLVTPFTAEIHGRIAANFAAEGVPLADGRHLGLEQSRDMADVPPSAIANLLRACLDAGSGGALCFCTNFRGLDACAAVADEFPSALLLDSVGLTLEAVGALSNR